MERMIMRFPGLALTLSKARPCPRFPIWPVPRPIRCFSSYCWDQHPQHARAQRTLNMQKTFFAAAFALAVISAGFAAAAPAAYEDPLAAQTLSKIKSQFSTLVELANRHDVKALHEMFWQSPSALLVAKSAVPSEGNWAGFWGNDAIDQKLRDIAASGGVVIVPDLSKLKVAGRTPEWAESYVPATITVSYAGQDGTPKPFLIIINWIKVAQNWKIASEIILPVPPPPASWVK
jgi:hypothetical protein